MKHYFIVILLVFFFATFLSGAQLIVEEVSSNNFPLVELYVRTIDFKESKDIDFEIYEDNTLIPFEEISLLSKDIRRKLDVLFVIDLSRENMEYLNSAKLSIENFLNELSRNSAELSLKLGTYVNNFNLVIDTDDPEDFLKVLNTSTRNPGRIRNRMSLSELLVKILDEVQFKEGFQKLVVIVGDPPYDPENRDKKTTLEKLKNALNLRQIGLVFYSKEPDNYKEIALSTSGAIYDLKLTDDMSYLYNHIKNIYEERFRIKYNSPSNNPEGLKTHELRLVWSSAAGNIEKVLTYKEPLKIAMGIENVVKATGYGAPRPDFSDPYRKFLSARDAAILNAREQLLETVKGIQISSNKTLGEMMLEDYIIDKNIRGFLMGAKIINESWDPENETYMVEMAVNLTGTNGLMGELEVLNKLRNNIIGFSKDSNINLRYVDRYGFTDSLIYAEGYGLAKPSKYTAVSIQNARRAAIAEAQKELLATLKGISIVGNTFVSNHMIVELKIREYLNGILRGAEIIEEKLIAQPTENNYGLYKVKMAVRWDQRIGLQRELADIMKDLRPGEIYIGSSLYEKNGSLTTYTGLIIDATGLGLKPTLFPEIVSEDGKRLYSFDVVEDEYRRKYSIVEYHKTLSEALKSRRVGGNPLIIGAKAVKDGVQILIDSDILQEIMKSSKVYDFLKEGKVVIVGG